MPSISTKGEINVPTTEFLTDSDCVAKTPPMTTQLSSSISSPYKLPATKALVSVMLLALTSEQKVVLHLVALVTTDVAEPTAFLKVTLPSTSLLI